MFDVTKSFELDGVVSRVDWVNPHVQVYVDGKDAKGKPLTYKLESLPVAMMRKAGLSKTALLGEGKPVHIKAHPARSGEPGHGYMLHIKFADGREIQFSKVPGRGRSPDERTTSFLRLPLRGTCAMAATPPTATSPPRRRALPRAGRISTAPGTTAAASISCGRSEHADGSVCVTGCPPAAAPAAAAAVLRRLARASAGSSAATSRNSPRKVE